MRTAILFISLLLLFSESAFSSGKTACTITLNSSNEADVFRKYLEKQLGYNFIELTTLGTTQEPSKVGSGSSFLQAACQAQIQCDLMIVSGHFGGTFFGSSGYKMSLDELETAACDPACSGVLSHPREVFLFGCNTLAGKGADRRSPEEYRRALAEHDEFTPAEIDRIVAFRYSPLGESFSDRMREVFVGVPRIYGFSSVGPSGATSEPFLNQYLKAAVRNGYYTDLSKLNSDENPYWTKAMFHTAKAQVSGVHSSQATDRLVCKLSSDHPNFSEVIEKVTESIQTGHFLEEIDAINLLTDKTSDMNPVELGEFERKILALTPDPSIIKFLGYRDSAIFISQLKVLDLVSSLKWISSDQADKIATQLIFGNFSSLDQTWADEICSIPSYYLRKGLTTKLSDVPQEVWRNPSFFHGLACMDLRQMPEVLNKLLEIGKTTTNGSVRLEAVLALKPTLCRELNFDGDCLDDSTEKNEADFVLDNGFAALSQADSPDLRMKATATFMREFDFGYGDGNFIAALPRWMELERSSSDVDVRRFIVKRYLKIPCVDPVYPAIRRRLIEIYRSEVDPEIFTLAVQKVGFVGQAGRDHDLLMSILTARSKDRNISIAEQSQNALPRLNFSTEDAATCVQ